MSEDARSLAQALGAYAVPDRKRSVSELVISLVGLATCMGAGLAALPTTPDCAPGSRAPSRS